MQYKKRRKGYKMGANGAGSVRGWGSKKKVKDNLWDISKARFAKV